MQKSKLINKAVFFLVGILFVASFLWMAKAAFIGYYPDFNTQYTVPQMVFSGQNPYKGGEGLYTPQVYPPTVFLLYLPIGLLPLETASYVFTFLSILSLVVSLIILAKMFDIKFFSITNMILLILVFNFFPVKFTLGMGQVNNFILLILVICLFFIKKGWEYRAGLMLGISLAIKFFPLFLPIYLVFRIRPDKKFFYGWDDIDKFLSLSFWKNRIWYSPSQIRNGLGILGGIFTVLILSIILVMLFIPWDINIQFVTEVLPSLFTSWKTDYYNQALSGFISRSFGTADMASVIKLILTGVLSVAVLWSVGKNDKRDFETNALRFGIFITISILINNFSWQHHFVWMIIPFYATFAILQKIKTDKNLYLILFVSYFLIAINFKDPQSLPVLLQSHVFFGALILLLLGVRLLLIDRKN